MSVPGSHVWISAGGNARKLPGRAVSVRRGFLVILWTLGRHDRAVGSRRNLIRVRALVPWLAGEARDRPVVMGVLNVTPDSFSDGGRYADLDSALAHGMEMIRDGADLVDVGGGS